MNDKQSRAEQPPGRRRGILGQRQDPPVPADHVLGRHGARLLNPVRSPRATTREVGATAYVADRLIVPAGEAGAEALDLLRKVANGLELVEEDCHLLCEDGPDLEPGDERLLTAYRLRPSGSKTVVPDAWVVLEAARAEDAKTAAVVSLDHLMFGPGIGGTAPYTSGHGTGEGTGLASYGQVGSGGRQVVSWTGADPVRSDLPEDRRPRVALLDTGCGEHPWLKQGVKRYRVGAADDRDDPEKYADQESPLLGELDSHSGHGTFVAGLIRQRCPDADLMSIRVMGSDGVVKEWETLHVLQALLTQMRRWVGGDDSATRVDVIVMSLGYYHETEIDEYYTFLLRNVLAELGKLGVVVVAAAGNDATTRPFYPAALAPPQDAVRRNDRIPVIAAGSLNPDEKSIALFNNHGPWIRYWRPSVSLVSTVPTTMSGALQPRVALPEALAGEPAQRATIDDDDFHGGFAVWSGTSFAAPVLAAEIAEAMLKEDAKTPSDKPLPRADWLKRSRRAVDAIPTVRRRP